MKAGDGTESEATISADASDRLKAIDILAKYGLGTTKELTVEHVKDRLRETIAIINEELEPAQAEKLLARLDPIWQ